MIPALLPFLPAVAKGVGILGAGTGISSAIAQIPYLKKRAIKNAATKDEYNPATQSFRPGYEWDPGDTAKAFLGGYSKQDVLNARQEDFKKRATDRFAGQKAELKAAFEDLGFKKLPRGMDVRVGDDMNVYQSRLNRMGANVTAMEELQGKLGEGQTLQNLGLSPNSKKGSIASVTKRIDAADPLSPLSLHRDNMEQRGKEFKLLQDQLAEQIAGRKADGELARDRFEEVVRENKAAGVRAAQAQLDAVNASTAQLEYMKGRDANEMERFEAMMDRQDRIEEQKRRQMLIQGAVQSLGAFF